MARPRAYNHDIRCPHCGSNWTPKDGRSRRKQTYRRSARALHSPQALNLADQDAML